jgi:predicted amidophosphoribosyltransferase
MTTGATMGAAARTLKKAGAKAVYAAIAARASLGSDI